MNRDRRLAYLILKDIASNDSWSNLTTNSYLKKEGADSPAFVREIVYGVLRNQRLLDANIARFLQKPGLGNSERIILRMGFYQLAMMDGVSDYAAVSETVEIARVFKKGSEKFINAVLRSFQREGSELRYPNMDREIGELLLGEQIERLSVRYSCDESIAAIWIDAFGPVGAEKLLDASCSVAPVAIRANTVRLDAQELAERLRARDFKVENAAVSGGLIVSGHGLLDTEEYKNGLFHVQGESSQLAAEILAPRAGDLVLDLCAAPGGKSFAMAELMKDSGEIMAFDLYPHRVELIEKEAARLGLGSISTGVFDATGQMPELFGKADCVLCDVPCSGLGTLRENPELKLKRISVELPDTQLRILENAAKYVRDGGKLLYSTCTVNPRENEEVIKCFLEDTKGFDIEYEKQLFTEKGGADGFYICLMRRI